MPHLATALLKIMQGEEFSEEELPGSLVDELEERVSPEQRHFAAFQARVSESGTGCRVRLCAG